MLVTAAFFTFGAAEVIATRKIPAPQWFNLAWWGFAAARIGRDVGAIVALAAERVALPRLGVRAVVGPAAPALGAAWNAAWNRSRCIAG